MRCKKRFTQKDWVEAVVATNLGGVSTELIRCRFNFIFHFSNQKHYTAKIYNNQERVWSIRTIISADKKPIRPKNNLNRIFDLKPKII